jgi:type III secretion protein L
MSFVLIRADAAATLMRDDPIVRAADVPVLGDVQRLLADAQALREDARAASVQAGEAARDEGYAAGHAEGLAAGAALVREELLRLAQADVARAEAQRTDLARLGLEVVRRIAADLGPADMVAALAEKAAAAIAPDSQLTVRVPAAALDATRARLGAGVAVEPDETLSATDCVLSTPLGEVRAGLETQLAQLARQWNVEA